MEVSPAGILQHQVEAAGRLHHFVQMQHIGVSQELHAADLPGQQALHLGVHPGLIQDLQGHFVCEQREQKDGSSRQGVFSSLHLLTEELLHQIKKTEEILSTYP